MVRRALDEGRVREDLRVLAVKLSEHFDLKEFLHYGTQETDVPPNVLENLLDLCATLLEPAREALGFLIRIGSGWRPERQNQAVGGVPGSDHLTGCAADCQGSASQTQTWEENTFELFDWLRVNKAGKFGQLLIEDHRLALANPAKLWVHVALPSARHPGAGPNTVLVSTEPRSYRPWTTAGLA